MSRSAELSTPVWGVFTSWCGVIWGLWIVWFCYCGQQNKSFLTPCSWSPSRAAEGLAPHSSRCSDPWRSNGTDHHAVPQHHTHTHFLRPFLALKIKDLIGMSPHQAWPLPQWNESLLTSAVTAHVSESRHAWQWEIATRNTLKILYRMYKMH